MAETQKDLTNLLNEFDVARIAGRSVSSVRTWRWARKGGPRYVKIGASVRYRPEDIARWLESRPTGGGEYAAPVEPGEDAIQQAGTPMEV